MLNISSVSDTVALGTQNTLKSNVTAAPTSTKVASQASTVVNLQGTNVEKSDLPANKLDSESAASMALDIASMLGGNGDSVQANLSGFDAARLLAD